VRLLALTLASALAVIVLTVAPGLTVPPAGASTTWQQVFVADPLTSGSQALSAVNCLTASDCMAVLGGQELVHFNGASWSVVASSASTSVVPDAVAMSCVSDSACMLVGFGISGADQPRAGFWNGTAWTSVSAPTAGSALSSVTCLSSTDCWATGNYYTGGVHYSYVDQWTGGSAFSDTGAAEPANGGSLEGISCTGTSTTACVAVGTQSNGSANTALSLVERYIGPSTYNGTAHWAIDTTAQSPGTSSNILWGVSCLSATDCTAVGEQDSPGTGALIEQFNGTSWSQPANAANPGKLASVSCTTNGVTDDCVAAASATAIEEGNASGWSEDSLPSFASSDQLFSVSCWASASCMAAGLSQPGGGTFPLALTTSTGSFTPAVSVVSAASGPEAGGNTITIGGSGFTDGTATVDVGTTAATVDTVASDKLTVTVPASTTASTVDVTVTTSAGTTATSAADHYTYLAPPTVTGVSPGTGAPGSTVVISGTGFTSVKDVKFGSTVITSLYLDPQGDLEVAAPSGSGTVDVTVDTANGSSATSPAPRTRD
jgi:hypothetical protein